MGWNNTELFDPGPDCCFCCCPNRCDPVLFCPDLELWSPEFEFPATGAKFREATASDLLRFAGATASVSRGRKRLRGCLCCALDGLLLLLLTLKLLLLPVFLFLVLLLLPPPLPLPGAAAAAAAVPVTPHR